MELIVIKMRQMGAERVRCEAESNVLRTRTRKALFERKATGATITRCAASQRAGREVNGVPVRCDLCPKPGAYQYATPRAVDATTLVQTHAEKFVANRSRF